MGGSTGRENVAPAGRREQTHGRTYATPYPYPPTGAARRLCLDSEYWQGTASR